MTRIACSNTVNLQGVIPVFVEVNLKLYITAKNKHTDTKNAKTVVNGKTLKKNKTTNVTLLQGVNFTECCV